MHFKVFTTDIHRNTRSQSQNYQSKSSKMALICVLLPILVLLQFLLFDDEKVERQVQKCIEKKEFEEICYTYTSINVM